MTHKTLFPNFWHHAPPLQIPCNSGPFCLNPKASNFLNPGTSDFLKSTSVQVPSIWHSAIRNLLTHNDTSEAINFRKYHQCLPTLSIISDSHNVLCSPDVSAIPTYLISKPTQSSDSQLLNSYQGIIDICCHSVRPSHMVVLRIPLWLTCYDFYYQQGIEQHFPSNLSLLTFKKSPSVETLPSSTPFAKLLDPVPEIPDQVPDLPKPPFHWYNPWKPENNPLAAVQYMHANLGLNLFPSLDL